MLVNVKLQVVFQVRSGVPMRVRLVLNQMGPISATLLLINTAEHGKEGCQANGNTASLRPPGNRVFRFDKPTY